MNHRIRSVAIARISVCAAGVATCLGLAVVSPAHAQAFRDRADVPDHGLRIPVFAGAARDTLAMPDVAMSREGEDGYDFRELWYRSQWIGQWTAGGGARLRVGAATWLPPRELFGEIVKGSRFNQVRELGTVPGTPQDLAAWIGLFAEAPASPAGGPSRTYMHVQEALRFTLTPKRGHAVAYAFRFRANAHGVDVARWYVVVIESALTDAAKLASTAEQEWLAGVAIVGPPRTPASPQAAAGAVTADPAVAAADSTREASLLAAQRSIEGLKGWWALPSRNFVVVTSLKPTRRKFVEDMLAECEALRERWTAMLPPIRPIEAVSVIRLFGEEKEYLDYVGAKYKHFGGLWNPRRRELVIRSIDHLPPAQRRDWQRTVLYHESMHQYIFYAFSGTQPSVWYDEGHATLMEGAEIGRTGVEVDEVAKYAAAMDERVRAKKPLEFDDLLSMTHDRFYSPEPKQSLWNYSRAWALMYYLRKAAPATGADDDRAILARYYKAMHEGGGPEAATKAAFEGVDIGALEDRFVEFWKSSRSRSAARRVDPFASSIQRPD